MGKRRVIDLKLIGKRIHDCRMDSGFTQGELAEATGLSMTYISNLENGKKTPSLETLVLIGNAVNVSMDELLLGNTEYGTADYQIAIDYRLTECSMMEQNFIYDCVTAIRSIIREKGWNVKKDSREEERN